MQKSRQYSLPPQVSQQKKGTNEHFCTTDALDAADDSKDTQKPAGNGKSPHSSARRSPQPSARSKPRVNGYDTFTTDTSGAFSISAKRSSLLAFPSSPEYDSAVDEASHPRCWSWRHVLRNRVCSVLLLVPQFGELALFSRSMNDFIHALATRHGMIGLAGQVIFGLMPVVASRP